MTDARLQSSWTEVQGSGGGTPAPRGASANVRGRGRGGLRPSDPSVDDLKAAIAAARPGSGEIASLIKAKGASLRGPVFTSLLKECGRAGAHEKGREVFAAMVAAGIPANVYTYGALIGCMSACGQAAEAERAFEEMQAAAADDSSLAPNTIIWSALISACERGGAPAKALDYFDAMLVAGVAPDHITFAAALAAADRARDADAALRLLDRMHAAGAAAPSDTYVKIMELLGNRWGDAVELFVSAQLAGADATRPLVSALAAALTAGGPPAARSAAQLFDAVRALRGGDPAMTAAALAAVASTCEWRIVQRAWARAKASGVRPTAAGAVALVEAAKNGGGDVAALEAELAKAEG